MCEQKQTPPVKVEVKNLTKKFGDLLVLDNISFDVYQGDLLCVVGPTGCGKTTFLNSLTKIYDITSGQILLDGKPGRSENEQHCVHLPGGFHHALADRGAKRRLRAGHQARAEGAAG